MWRHTPYGDKYVTVILDVRPVHDRSGPSRLLDMVPGRSKGVFKTWLASQSHTWRERIEIVAMDGFTGFKSAAAEELPDARAVMDPFHVVHLAGDALDECRRRTGQELHHRRGRSLSIFLCMGLEVGGDSVGVGGGELGEGLFPVGGGVSLDEAGVSCSFVGGFACVCEALGGAFVFDVADGEP